VYFLFRLNVAGSKDNNDLNGIGNLQQRDGYKARILKDGEKVEKNTGEKCDLM